MLNPIDTARARADFCANTPFDHLVWDDFWRADVAAQLADEIASVAVRANAGGGGIFMTTRLRKKSRLTAMTVFRR